MRSKKGKGTCTNITPGLGARFRLVQLHIHCYKLVAKFKKYIRKTNDRNLLLRAK